MAKITITTEIEKSKQNEISEAYLWSLESIIMSFVGIFLNNFKYI